MSLHFMLVALWFWHFLFVGLLTYAIGRAAYNKVGRPRLIEGWTWVSFFRFRFPWLRWPIQGRWLLTALLAEFCVIFADVALRAYGNLDKAHQANVTWPQVILRALPCMIEPWVFLRQWKRGLLNDPE